MPVDLPRRREQGGERQLLLWTSALGVAVMLGVLVITGFLAYRGHQDVDGRNPPASSAPTTGQGGRR